MIGSNPGIPLLNDIPTVFIPVLWMEQEATMPEDFAWKIQWVLRMQWIGTLWGIIILLTGASCFMVICNARKNSKQIIVKPPMIESLKLLPTFTGKMEDKQVTDISRRR